MQKVDSGPAFTTGVRFNDSKPSIEVPGPGEYHQPHPDGGKSFTMAAKHKEASELPQPGPGEYVTQQECGSSGPAYTMASKPAAAAPLLCALLMRLPNHRIWISLQLCMSRACMHAC